MHLPIVFLMVFQLHQESTESSLARCYRSTYRGRSCWRVCGDQELRPVTRRDESKRYDECAVIVLECKFSIALKPAHQRILSESIIKGIYLILLSLCIELSLFCASTENSDSYRVKKAAFDKHS